MAEAFDSVCSAISNAGLFDNLIAMIVRILSDRAEADDDDDDE